MVALKELIDLQKNRIITIKPADKRSGIVLLNFEDYWKSCFDHLNSQQLQPDGTFLNYYEKDEENFLEEAQETIFKLVEEGYDNGYISKEEFETLNPLDKEAARIMLKKLPPTFRIPHTS